MSTPPVDKALHYYERFDRELRGQLKGLVTDDVTACLPPSYLSNAAPRGRCSATTRRVSSFG